MSSDIKYSVSILCGGRSTRMGYDKAMMDWNGTPLLMHIVGGFSECDDLFLSVRDDEQYKDLPLRKVYDPVPDSGPLAGLCASLAAAAHETLFITTCDAPLIDEKTAGLLVSALKDQDCVVPVSGDFGIHPLIAVYRKNVLEKAMDNLNRGELRIRSLLDDLNVLYYPASSLPFGDRTLSNLNTPQDTDRFHS